MAFGWGKFILDCNIVVADISLLLCLLSLVTQLRRTRTAKGISLLTLVIIVISRCLHSLSHPVFGLHFFPTVLPMSLFLLMDVANAILGICVVVFFVKYYWHTYEVENDDFGSVVLRKLGVDSVVARWVLLHSVILTSAVAWNIFRRGNHTNVASALFCSYYEVMGFFALLPQLWMFQRDKVVSQALGNFIGFTALHRFLTLLFWIAFPIVYKSRVLDNRIIQMVSEVINLLILSDFLFYYIRSKIRGEKDIVISEELV